MSISQMIKNIQDTIYYFRIQNYHQGCILFRKLLSEIQESEEIMLELLDKEGMLFQIVSQLLQTLEKNDLILLGDMLEENLLPIMRRFVKTEEAINAEEYCVESTLSGYWTVKHMGTGLYLHSNINPMEEAATLVRLCYDPNVDRYAVWGIGLGYHILRLFEEARGSVEITVFEPDNELVDLAMQYGVLSTIEMSKINIIVDTTGRAFSEYIMQDNVGVLMHYPSIKKIQNEKIREILSRFFADWNGTIQYKQELLVNFRKNKKNCSTNVDVLRDAFYGKKVVIVGAGPSLDNGVEFLKNKDNDTIIVAVTTVLKKLTNRGIIPDYAVVMDSQMRTFEQIEGLRIMDTPLLVDSTACWRFAEEYKGKKYIVYQKGLQEADRCAREESCQQYETGGSVTTLALEIALKLGATAVYLLGVDLAYPNGISHAEGTMDRVERDTEGMKRVKSVNEDWVYTDLLFDSYRVWIENKIKEYPQVDFYNLSTCGAYIEGCGRISDKA